MRRMEPLKTDILIAGAGASGLAAACSSLRAFPGVSVLLAERNDCAGRKLRATGSGRCNITNRAAEGSEDAIRFLEEEIGIPVKTLPESGLCYPYSESAKDVAEAFVSRVLALGGRFLCEASVQEVRPVDGGFLVRLEKKGEKNPLYVQASKLILALGGKAGPTYGTTGDGYAIARSLGHLIVPPIPILTSVECGGDGCEPLKGTRARGRVRLYRSDAPAEPCFTEDGEIQFTWYGLSGIAVFNMTRMMRYTREEGIGIFRIELDLCPDRDALSFLQTRRAQEQAAGRKSAEPVPAGDILRSLLKENLAAYVLQRAGIDTGKVLSDLTDRELSLIAGQVHALSFRPTGLKGWKEAQCTKGGVKLDEISGLTSESRLVPGLYITGELQDYDGPCGGFNLNHAWLTGRAAGLSAAASVRKGAPDDRRK